MPLEQRAIPVCEITYYSQDIVNPTIANSQSDETKDERGDRHTQRHKYSPYTHVTSSFVLEECLSDNARSDGSGRADKKAHDGTA